MKHGGRSFYLHKLCREGRQGRQVSIGVPQDRRSKSSLRYRKGRRPLALAVSTME